VILIPVLNILGFERHSRYLPDRRDLNRCFPGSASGSLASRMARILFTEIVGRADFGIDLHTAALRRTNFPNVRADMSDPAVVRLAEAFGSEIVLDGKGPKGAFRREACKAGCPTIIFEGGEVWKVEPTIVEYALRGVRNVLAELGMIEQPARRAQHQVTVRRTKWVRADRGGFLQFHAAPGDILERRQPIATNTSLLGRDRNVLDAPFDGIVLGMTTLPAEALPLAQPPPPADDASSRSAHLRFVRYGRSERGRAQSPTAASCTVWVPRSRTAGMSSRAPDTASIRVSLYALCTAGQFGK
jgi:predicted deacylase